MLSKATNQYGQTYIRPPQIGGFMLLLPFVMLLASCVSQRLPDGAYIPARNTATAIAPQTSSATVAPISMHVSRSEAAAAAEALGIRSERTDNAHLLTLCASYLGTPYRYGGNDRDGLDCSGLTTIVYREVYGIDLHRRSIDQYEKDVPKVRLEGFQQGDLLFFTTNGRGTCSHVGIYLKGGRFVHASSTRGVVVDNLSDTYYSTRFLGGGRP